MEEGGWGEGLLRTAGLCDELERLDVSSFWVAKA